MTKFEIALGDKQFPMADLTYVVVEAEDRDAAKEKAREGHSWAFIMSCVEKGADQ